MWGKTYHFLGLALAISLGACSSTREQVGEAGSFAYNETEAVVQDAVGLARERPGPVMVDDVSETVPTPYGGEGSRRRCSSVARDIARITVVLGPDIEEQHRLEEIAEREARDDESLWSQSTYYASQAPDAAASGARDLYRSTIVGLNPVRPVVRFIGGASRTEREAQEIREMGQRRRAYLRGLYDGFGCPPVQMRRAFEAYGLIEEAG